MFKSYHYIGSILDNRTYYHQYTIVDDDFDCTDMEIEYMGDVPLGTGDRGSVGLAKAVISTYEKRGLLVLPNLVKAFLWKENEFPMFYSFETIVESNRLYNPAFAPYIKDMEKYMVLL
jgi:hypothetical protein